MLLTAFARISLVFTLMRTFLGVSLNFAFLCKGECYTEFLSFSSKVKAEAPFSAPRCWPQRNRLISTPQDPFRKIIALGLFDILSEAIAVFLTVPLLLGKEWRYKWILLWCEVSVKTHWWEFSNVSSASLDFFLSIVKRSLFVWSLSF